MWTRLRSVLGSAWRRPAWRRLCRPGLVPPLILLIAFLVFHMALRGSGQRLDSARWVLGPLVRDYRGVGAYHPRTGQPLWFYPGRVDSVESGPEFLYVVSASFFQVPGTWEQLERLGKLGGLE